MAGKGDKDTRVEDRAGYNKTLGEIDWSDGPSWTPKSAEDYSDKASQDFEAPQVTIKSGPDKRARASELAENMFSNASSGDTKIDGREFMNTMKKEYGDKSVNPSLMEDLGKYNEAMVTDRGGDASRTETKKSVKDWKQEMGEYKMNSGTLKSRDVKRDIATKNGETKLFKGL